MPFRFDNVRHVTFLCCIVLLSLVLSFAPVHAMDSPELLLPAQDADVVGETARFEWSDSGAETNLWALWVGTTPGGRDIFQKSTDKTFVTVTNLPANGSTLYARLYTKPGTTWNLVSEHSFTSQAGPEILLPVENAQLNSSSTSIEWTDNGGSIDTWALWAGTSPGGRDIHNRVETGTSAMITNLPQDGSTVYVRLYSLVQGIWSLVDSHQYLSVETARPELLLPNDSDQLDTASATFNWTDNGTTVDKWALWVGDTPGGKELYNRSTTAQSLVVDNLPTDGSPIFARLYAYRDGRWDNIDEIALTSANIDLSQITSHTSGSTLANSTVQFEWATSDHNVNTWAIWVGTSEGGRDLYNRVVSANNATVSNLPTNGDDIYLRLYALRNGSWSLEDTQEYTATNPLPPTPVDLTEYDLTFNDEFDGYTLDTNKWATSYLWGPFVSINAEEQYYVDTGVTDAGAAWSPFDVSDGVLTISAIPTDSVHSATEQPNQTSDYWLQNPEYKYNADYESADANYLSGVIASYKSYSFTHGYVESRVKVPAGKGLWSAFWLHTFKFVEDVPEIDIMEHLGEPVDVVHQTMHYFDVNDNWRLVSTPTHNASDTDYSENFHTYSVSWEPNKVDFFIDGILIHSVNDNNFKIAKQAMHIIANLAVGGAWPGSPDSSTQFPAQLAIDYIRVYQKKPLGQLTASLLDSEYELMFSDDFNGTQLDNNKWNTSYLWGPFYRINNEEQYYPDIHGRDDQFTDTTITVNNGTLKIHANEIATSELPTQPPLNDAYWSDSSHQHNPDYGDVDGWIPKYTSGLITSYDSFKFVHGYAEANVKIPEGSGLWPAFWLLNGYYVGPQPEIDIMEARGGSTHEVHHSYHFSNNNGQLISQTQASAHLGTGFKYSDNFHRYGVEWRPGSIDWYIDGQIVHSLTGPEVSLQLAYIIANLAVGGNYVGTVSPSALPATLEIDYIKVWQRR